MKSCFGTIYPDLEQFQFGKPMVGKVFQITVNTVGPGKEIANWILTRKHGKIAGDARTSRIASTSQR